MTDASDFDLKDMLHALNPIIEGYEEGSRERRATALAQLALLFIHEGGKEAEFARFYQHCTDPSFTIAVSREFATREEADEWFASGTPQHQEQVKIAGKGFMAVQVSDKWYFVSAPLPEELKTAEWTDDSE